MKKKKKLTNSKLFYILIGVVVLIIVVVLIVLGNIANEDYSDFQEQLKEDGYNATNNYDAFFKKIVSNNTLDDYYKDIANKTNSLYEEYSLSKESYDYIELKMEYQNDIITVLNIISNLKSSEINFNFELTYNDSHIILDGNSSSDYECNVVLQKESSNDTVLTYCHMIRDEINTFKESKEELLKNKAIKKIIDKPISEIQEQD